MSNLVKEPCVEIFREFFEGVAKGSSGTWFVEGKEAIFQSLRPLAPSKASLRVANQTSTIGARAYNFTIPYRFLMRVVEARSQRPIGREAGKFKSSMKEHGMTSQSERAESLAKPWLGTKIRLIPTRNISRRKLPRIQLPTSPMRRSTLALFEPLFRKFSNLCRSCLSARLCAFSANCGASLREFEVNLAALVRARLAEAFAVVALRCRSLLHRLKTISTFFGATHANTGHILHADHIAAPIRTGSTLLFTSAASVNTDF